MNPGPSLIRVFHSGDFSAVNDSSCASEGLSYKSGQGGAEGETLKKWAIEITKLDPGAICAIVKICFVFEEFTLCFVVR